MKHEVAWTKDVIMNFIEYGHLDEEQKRIMALRTSNHSDIEIADDRNFSIATYYRKVKELKSIYDDVQRNHPELNMPERKLINEKLFEFYTLQNAIEFISNIDWETEKIELRIVRKTQ